MGKSPTTPTRTSPASTGGSARAASPTPHVAVLVTPPPPPVMDWQPAARSSQHGFSFWPAEDHHLAGPELKDSFDESLDAIFEPSFDAELAIAFSTSIEGN